MIYIEYKNSNLCFLVLNQRKNLPSPQRYILIEISFSMMYNVVPPLLVLGIIWTGHTVRNPRQFSLYISTIENIMRRQQIYDGRIQDNII